MVIRILKYDVVMYKNRMWLVCRMDRWLHVVLQVASTFGVSSRNAGIMQTCCFLFMLAKEVQGKETGNIQHRLEKQFNHTLSNAIIPICKYMYLNINKLCFSFFFSSSSLFLLSVCDIISLVKRINGQACTFLCIERTS